MAASSIHEGIVLIRDDIWGAGDDPMDAAIMRDVLGNGVLHAMDSMAQCRVNFTGFAGQSNRFGYSIPRILQNTALDATWQELRGSPFGIWPVTLKNDGTPYKLRIRAAVASANDQASFSLTTPPSAGVAVTMAFRFVLAPLDRGLEFRDETEDHSYQLSFTSGSPGVTATWVTGASRGAGAYATYLQLSASRAEEWTSEVGVFDSTSGGGTRAISQCLVALHGFAYSGGFESSGGQNDGAVPVLRALHAEEFAG
jgi:hypothetical protein